MPATGRTEGPTVQDLRQKVSLPYSFLVFLLIAVVFIGCEESDNGDDDSVSDADFDDDSGRDADRDRAESDADVDMDARDADIDELQGPLTQFPWSAESDDVTCDDGIDNDDNGYTDCEDFACARNLAVTVCGDDAHYEASPEACTNDRDDDRDGLEDCRDPDCQQNPFHAVCEYPEPETDCEGESDTDRDGFTGCADFDCQLFGCSSERLRVLFDQTLDETAAGGRNSDWIVDGWGRNPTPSNPTSPNDWNGALSSFGYALLTSGDFLVESLPSWDGHLSFGEASNPQDLSLYHVLVVIEPSRWMTESEKRAIVEFVQGGGGLLAVANHVSADRDGNGVSAPHAWNDLFDDNSVQVDPFGFRFDLVDVDTGPLTNVTDEAHPVIEGAAGRVESIGFFMGCTAHLTGTNTSAQGLVFLDGERDGFEQIVVGVAEVGAGRVVIVTDSAIAGDGSDSHGTIRLDHDAWNTATEDNATLFINAVRWLARLE